MHGAAFAATLNKHKQDSTGWWCYTSGDCMPRHHRVIGYSLKDVSPRLAAMRNTSIPMTGVVGVTSGSSAVGGPGASSQTVTIARVVDEVTVLPTKTRPKKLQMIGSDGKTYTYLVKVCVHLAGLSDICCSNNSCSKRALVADQGEPSNSPL